MFVLSNLETYLAIAKSALDESQKASAEGRRPFPDGRPGVIVALDPEQRSFKQGLVALVFSGVFLEALLYLEGRKRLGPKYRDELTYEKKLAALGVNDPVLLQGCARLRAARKSVVHEKAAGVSEFSSFMRAQEEAALAVALVQRVRDALLPTGAGST